MTPQTVLDFWFGAPEPRRSQLWWGKDPALDEEIRARFAGPREQAIAGQLQDWEASPRGRLALILLVDQFSRNLFRNSPRAFAHDALAQRWSLEGLELGLDRQLGALERLFFYLPLEHSEDLADQERAVALFEELVVTAPPEERAERAGYLDYARRHRAIIARFGRFPHRNDVLGRLSTPDEAAFLQQPGSSF